MDKIDSKNTVNTKRLFSIFWAIEASLVITAIQRFFYESYLVAIVVVLSMLAILPIYFLAKKGKTELGSNILLLFLTVLFLGFVWAYNGLRDEVLMVFPAIIMVSLLMGSQRFAIYIYFLVSVNILAIGYLNEINIIHNASSESNLGSAVLLTIILTFTSYVAWLIAAEIRKTNKELSAAKSALEKRVKERTAELEETIIRLTNTQEQLIQTEKMASLGRLVAGVAHEINTPIGIAVTASSYLEYETENFSKRYDNNNISKKSLAAYIDTSKTSSKLIQSNLKRAAKLVQGFKDVAVDQSSDEVREFELKYYLNEILESLHPKIKRSGCQIDLVCPDNLSIKSSPGAIAQIITNLVINAIIHAFENDKNGIITINIEQQSDHINLLFKDTGCGISPSNLNSIFEPFFTTKRGEGGSGLGMHIVYNLVTQSLNGSIECNSTLGEGTTFLISFPCNIETN